MFSHLEVKRKLYETRVIYGVVKNMAGGAVHPFSWHNLPHCIWQAGVAHQWPNDIHKKRLRILEMKMKIKNFIFGTF